MVLHISLPCFETFCKALDTKSAESLGLPMGVRCMRQRYVVPQVLSRGWGSIQAGRGIIRPPHGGGPPTPREEGSGGVQESALYSLTAQSNVWCQGGCRFSKASRTRSLSDKMARDVYRLIDRKLQQFRRFAAMHSTAGHCTTSM
jgi:hypothetical protein